MLSSIYPTWLFCNALINKVLYGKCIGAFRPSPMYTEAWHQATPQYNILFQYFRHYMHAPLYISVESASVSITTKMGVYDFEFGCYHIKRHIYRMRDQPKKSMLQRHEVRPQKSIRSASTSCTCTSRRLLWIDLHVSRMAYVSDDYVPFGFRWGLLSPAIC